MPSAPERSLWPTAVPTLRSVIEPTAPSVPPTPHTLLVTNAAARHVSFVDPTRGVMSRVEVGAAPWGLALGPDGLAYVATADGVAIVDIRRQARVAHIPYRAEVGSPTFGEYRAGGMGIAVAPDGRHVYVGVFLPDRSGQLEVIDAVQRTVIASAPIGVRPFQVLVSRDGREVYTIDHDTFTVTVVDARTYTARTLPVHPLGNEGWSSWDKPTTPWCVPMGACCFRFRARPSLILIQRAERPGCCRCRRVRISTASPWRRMGAVC